MQPKLEYLSRDLKGRVLYIGQTEAIQFDYDLEDPDYIAIIHVANEEDWMREMKMV